MSCWLLAAKCPLRHTVKRRGRATMFELQTVSNQLSRIRLERSQVVVKGAYDPA